METKITTNIETATEEIIRGNITALPTETVYGLAADALNPDAVLKIFETKRRPEFNPLIVHVFSIDDFSKYAEDIPDEVYLIAEKYSPGPVTYVLKKNEAIPDIVTAGIDTVALRIPSHIMFREVLKLSCKPIAAPSANMFGRISPTTAEEVFKELKGRIGYILDGGRCNIGIESTVISLAGDRISLLRPGFVTKEEIEAAVGRSIEETLQRDDKPDSPGMLKYHYAPVTPLYLTDNIEYFYNYKNAGIIDPGKYASLKEAALHLFSDMRNADEKNYEFIVAAKVDSKGLGRAINDRLIKASSGKVFVKDGGITFTKK